jgi:uncharacterized membrane protein
MRRGSSLIAATLVVVSVVGLVPPAAAAPPVVSGPTVLGTLGSGDESCAVEINDNGTVLGNSERTVSDPEQNAFLWSATGGMVDVSAATASTPAVDLDGNGTSIAGLVFRTSNGGTVNVQALIGSNGFPTAMNNSWQIGGYFVDVQAREHAMVWDPLIGVRDLGFFDGLGARIIDINESGAAVGSWIDNADNPHGFFWSAATGVVDLPDPMAGTSYDSPEALNENNEVVGNAGIPTGTAAYVWSQATGIVALGHLGGFSSSAFAINERGQVAGRAHNSSHQLRATIWTAATGQVDIGRNGTGVAINDHGQIVGMDVGGTSFVWDSVNGAVTLPGVPGVSGHDWPVTSINNRGQIVGCAQIATGTPVRMQAVLWTVSTPVKVRWTASEYTRIQQLMTFYDMDYNELTKFGVYVLAFINAIAPSPNPTPVVLGPAGNAQTQTIIWQPDEMGVLEGVKQRWVVNDEDAHRWGFMVLSFIAAIQGF